MKFAACALLLVGFSAAQDSECPGPFGNSLCRNLNGDDSFCRVDDDPMVCDGGNQACRCDFECPGPFGNSLCRNLNGDASYCRVDENEPVCAGGDQPCECDFTTTTTTTTTTTASSTSAGFCPGPMGNSYCRAINGGQSFCRFMDDPPVCQGGDQDCECEFTTSTTTSTTTTPTTTATSSSSRPGFCPGPMGNSYCRSLNGRESFCRTFADPMTCFRGDQECECEFTTPTTSTTTSTTTTTPSTTSSRSTRSVTTCPVGNKFCRDMVGSDSYCKFWLDPPVCQGGDEYECSCLCGNDLCEYFNGDGSYCKTFQDPQVCFGGDQECACP